MSTFAPLFAALSKLSVNAGQSTVVALREVPADQLAFVSAGKTTPVVTTASTPVKGW